MFKYARLAAIYAETEKGQECMYTADCLAQTIVDAQNAGNYALEMLYSAHLQDYINAVRDDTGWVLQIDLQGKPVLHEPEKFGLIKGRHEMPVDAYIFDRIDNVFDFAYQKAVIDDFLAGKRAVTVYVTGLTSVTATLISRCAHFGVALTLMHYDMTSGEYVPQVMEF